MAFIYEHESQAFCETLELLRGRKVAVLGHLRPDGDCIGSQVALCRVLRDAGVDAVCVNGHAVPRNLQFLVGDTPFYLGADFEPDGHFAICVDCAELDRPGEALVNKFPKPLVNIDHHISNTRYACLNLVLNSPATCAILAAFLRDRDISFDKCTAQALYTGIVTDTGQFKYPSTTPETLELAAWLLRRGAVIPATTSALYEQESPARLAMLQRFLASLQMYSGGRVCAGEVTQAAFAETGTTREDIEGFVDYARCLAGVDVAVIMEETPEGLKGSLRAKNPRYRVDLLGRELNGGGHVLSAGFFLRGAAFAEGRTRVLKTIATHLARVDAGLLPPLPDADTAATSA